VECLRLRVKDLDFAQRQILVRDGKGEKDRVTMAPYLPYALERKYPNAERCRSPPPYSRKQPAKSRARRKPRRR
jgi:hypothetical protein